MRKKESTLEGWGLSLASCNDPEFIAITDGKVFKDYPMFDPNDYFNADEIWPEEKFLEKETQKAPDRNYHRRI